jgi:hypothetical protein
MMGYVTVRAYYSHDEQREDHLRCGLLHSHLLIGQLARQTARRVSPQSRSALPLWTFRRPEYRAPSRHNGDASDPVEIAELSARRLSAAARGPVASP